MPRAKKTDDKQDALDSLVSGDGEEAGDTAQAEAEPTAEDTTTATGDQDTIEAQDQDAEAETETETEADPRADALASLVSGGAKVEETKPVPAPSKVKDTGRTVKIGTGKSRALVLADVYSGQEADGRPIVAWKGDTVILAAEKVDRGVRLGLLRKV